MYHSWVCNESALFLKPGVVIFKIILTGRKANILGLNACPGNLPSLTGVYNPDNFKRILNSFLLHVCIYKNFEGILDDWLTVHLSITLVDLQLDEQNPYLFVYNTFIKILYMFRALPCSSSGGMRRNCIYAASGIVTLLKVSCINLVYYNFLLCL